MLSAAQVNWSQWKSSLSCTRSVIGLSLTFCCPVRLGNTKPSSLLTYCVIHSPKASYASSLTLFIPHAYGNVLEWPTDPVYRDTQKIRDVLTRVYLSKDRNLMLSNSSTAQEHAQVNQPSKVYEHL